MNRRRWTALGVIPLVVLVLAVAACGSKGTEAQSESSPTTAVSTAGDPGEVLYQYATLNALMAGVYDGDLTVGELEKHGDQGLGTINKLDGEMLVLDGKAYQIAYDGRVHELEAADLTPFAVVTDFDADITLAAASPMTFDEVKAAIDRARPSANLPYAIRIEGTFASVKTRSVPAQTKPYRPLPEVLKEQAEFEFTDVKGTIVGFWLPAYMDGPNAGGYHMHFITASHDGGGHVLDCRPADVTVTLDETPEWTVDLPTQGDFLSTELSQEQYK
jgi:acetolactate decarboxylase